MNHRNGETDSAGSPSRGRPVQEHNAEDGASSGHDIIDDDTWTIRYLLINTLNWWQGKKVLVSPQWIERVSWGESKVFVDLSRETIKQSPVFMEEFLLSRDYEDALHRHYNRKGYWVDELVAK